jgi:hypothetical protein
MRKIGVAGLASGWLLAAVAAAAEPPAPPTEFGWFGAPFRLAGDSVFDFDAKSGRIRYANWADAGSLQQGEAYYDGGRLHFPDVKSRDEEPTTRSS